jgi:acyl transferase domain-containing protein/NADPH:quinone reductase-like Zn-dependent oxidoreductase/SAM-dependent methyltransferase/acyl carrier protein
MNQASNIDSTNGSSNSRDYRALMQSALLEIRGLKAALARVETAQTEPIAIVGIGCRLPGSVNDPDAFWKLLCDGKDAITEVPSDRWNLTDYYDANADTPGRTYTRYGGFIDHLDRFDAPFFGIADREARSIDPQQRLLLEVTWQALEQAGIIPTPDTQSGCKTGVFVGISSNDYSQQLLTRDPSEIDAYLATGNSHSTAAGRLSYVFGFTGPSIAVDTACSSSLVAAHLACQSLRSRECDQAIVGGVNCIISPEFSINFAKAKMLAPDGRCKTFDASADGFGRAEGCGVIVLKRLSDAVAQHCPILAVIKGSAVNQDGRSGGLTVPNGPSQQAVIQQALTNSNLQPDQISYIEAHGTGTALGDPIEVNAIAAVFGKLQSERSRPNPLHIGSVKTNIGHLEAAAGLAGLIKVVLSLKHQAIPAHLHVRQPSLHIDWENLPLSIPTQYQAWDSPDNQPRRAGISSFGFSGTNAHLILEEAIAENQPQSVVNHSNRSHHILTLSAKTTSALKSLAGRYREYLSICAPDTWAEICYGSNVGRTHFSERFALVAASTSEALEQLTTFIESAELALNNESVRIEASQLDEVVKSIATATNPSDWQSILMDLANLYVQGIPFDWTLIHTHRPQALLNLPTYPFEKHRYWIDRVARTIPNGSAHPLLGTRLNLARSQSVYFDAQISQNQPTFLQHHRVFNAVILPTSGYIEMMLAAGRQLFQTGHLSISQFSIQQSIRLSDQLQTVQTVITDESATAQIEFLSPVTNTSDWLTHATATIQPIQPVTTAISDLQAYREQCPRNYNLEAYYAAFQQHGIDYGADFRALTALWQGEHQALGKINLPENLTLSPYELHPVLLDAAFQVIGAALNLTDPSETYLPVGCEQFIFYGMSSDRLWSYAKLRSDDQNLVDLELISFDGTAIASVKGLELRNLSTRTQNQSEDGFHHNWFYQIEWQPQQLPAYSNKEHLNRDYLPTPESLRDRLLPELENQLTQASLLNYQNLLQNLEDISVQYIVNALHQLGWQPAVGDRVSIAQLLQTLAIAPQYHALFHRLLEILVEVGILKQPSNPTVEGDSTADASIFRNNSSNQTWIVVQPLSFTNLEPRSTHETVSDPELCLLDRCGSHLPSVLQGQTNPLQLLFPADAINAGSVYRESVGARVMNQSIQEILAIILANKPASQPIRILEIGAGTGGTTAYLLPTLADLSSVEYLFTDASPLFLYQAKQEFQNYPFVTYQTLNIEEAPAEQNINLNYYDLVIAANVIHATQDLEISFQHIHQLLAENGMLILLEGIRPMRWLDLTFGLTEGWWRFSDRHRTNYPLLTTQQWQQVLQSASFSGAVVTPDSEAQVVFVARAVSNPSLVAAASNPVAASPPIVLLVDQQGVGERLATTLRAKNQTVIEVYQDSNLETIQQQISHLETSSSGVQLIHLSSLDLVGTEAIVSPLESAIPSYLSLLQWIQSDLKIHSLFIITQGAISTHGEALPNIYQSPIWGLGKVINLEHPELNCKCIDLDATKLDWSASASETSTLKAESQIDLLLAELSTAQSTEKEVSIAFRQNQSYVARLTQTQPQPTSDRPIPSQPFQLTSRRRGLLDDLSFQPTARQAPQPDQVEIRVWATGINFIDVLDALNLLPFERDGFGVECAGEVVTIGSSVQTLKVGDRVVALAPNSFSQYTTVHAALVVPIPDQISYEAAATLPANFLTADYALRRVAQIKTGDRILIHAAAGGTGMAAVQIAQRAGAQVFATASPSKWNTLKQLGVEHVMNSRTLDFADQVMQLTNNEGVDIVLNSLSGDFITKSLSVLKPKGQFLEIGKRDVLSIAQVRLINPSVSYQLIDLMNLAKQQPLLIQSMLNDLINQLQANDLHLSPYSIFSAQQIIPAFRCMQQAKHIGKIVVSQVETSQVDTPQVDTSVIFNQTATPQATQSFLKSTQIYPNSIYLITGGLNGLGLLTAEWLLQQGATHLLLIGRRAPSVEAREKIQQWQQQGKIITTAQVDVTERSHLSDLLNTCSQPIRGIIHAAGVLADGLLQDLTEERLRSVMAPKVEGAWNLHLLTRDQPLDFFVLYSSAASLLGSPGQANHVAANTFLDALAHHRQAIGLPGLSINWGAWSDVGSAIARIDQMKLRGIDPITPQQGLKALEDLLQQPHAQVGAVPINWQRFRQQQWIPSFFDQFHADLPDNLTSPLLHQIRQQNYAPSTLIPYLQTEIAQVLGLSQGRMAKPQQGFFDLGMDSLMTVELKNRLETHLGIVLSPTVLFEHPTIQDLAQYLSEALRTVHGTSPPEQVNTIVGHHHAIEDNNELERDRPPDIELEWLTDIPIDATVEAELAELEQLLERN